MFNKLILKPLKRLFWLWLILMFLWLALFVSTCVRAMDQLIVEDATRITTYTGHFYFFRISGEPDFYGSLAMSYILASFVVKDAVFMDSFELDTARLLPPLIPFSISLANVTSETHSSDCYALVRYQAGVPPSGDLDIKLICPNSTYILPLE